MSDARAMLAAIHAAPDDDTPRLVFADWLDERGLYERSEFIRVQIELIRRAEVTGARSDEDDALFESLLARERELWSTFAESWFGGVGLLTGARVMPWTAGLPHYELLTT